MKKKINIKFVLLVGLVLGALITLPILYFFVLIFVISSIFCIKRFTKTDSVNFLITIFILGFILRIFLCVLNYNLGFAAPFRGGDTQPDAAIYDGNAFYIAHVLKGASDSERNSTARNWFLTHSIEKGYYTFGGKLPTMQYQYRPYAHMLGVLYAALGYTPIAIKLFNSLLGCISAILVYHIARILVRSERTAKISTVLVMFFPSIVYWSVTTLQDTVVNFLFLLYTLSLLICLAKDKWRYLFLAFICTLFLYTFKEKIVFLFLLGLIVIATIKFLRIVLSKKFLKKIVVTIAITMALIILIFLMHEQIANCLKDGLMNILNTHKGYATSYPHATWYRLYPENLYVKGMFNTNDFLNIGLIISIFKGLNYYFFSPFPWNVPYSHFFLLLFYPQIIFTFFCIPFAIMGVLMALRKYFLLNFAIILILSFLIVPQAMTEGIVGIVLRHRDMFMPYMIIFTSYGFSSLLLPALKNKGKVNSA